MKKAKRYIAPAIAVLLFLTLISVAIVRRLRNANIHIEISKTSTNETHLFYININSASASELMELPGIGPALAEAIIAHRTEAGPFESIVDLLDVNGIGQHTYEGLKDYITVG